MLHYYASFKDLIEAIIGLDRNVLHVHLGLALFILLRWCLPGPHRYRKAFFWLLVIELLNEFIDAMMALDRGRSPNVPDTIADIINTLFWPGVWCLWHRYRRHHPRPIPRPIPRPGPEAGESARSARIGDSPEPTGAVKGAAAADPVPPRIRS